MDCASDLLPTLDLLLRVDTWCCRVTDTLRGNLRSFCDDQARARRPLGVVGRIQRRRYIVAVGTIARQGALSPRGDAADPSLSSGMRLSNGLCSCFGAGATRRPL